MAIIDDLKQEIRTNIRTNGSGEITGQLMQTTLIDIVDDLVTKETEDINALNTTISTKASKDYVDDKVASIDVSTYATKTYVDNGLALKASESYVDEKISDLEIPTKTSDLVNDSDFTTKTYVDNGLALKADNWRVEVLEQSVSLKADKSYVDEMLGNIENLLSNI